MLSKVYIYKIIVPRQTSGDGAVTLYSQKCDGVYFVFFGMLNRIKPK